MGIFEVNSVLRRSHNELRRGVRLRWANEDLEEPARCAYLIIRETSPFLQVWGLVVALNLVYIGTLGLYQLAFLDFRLPASSRIDRVEWQVANMIVNCVFWIDLIVNFFISYRDKRNREVLDLVSTSRRYVYGFFIWDLMACIPWEQVLQSGGTRNRAVNTLVRVARIQRIWRLSQLTRLKPKLKNLAASFSNNTVASQVLSSRGVRIFTTLLGAFLVTHIFACGWYLLAALQDDPRNTWVHRRVVSLDDGETLLERDDPLLNWCNSVYFVLTTFCTVGYGDMSPVSPAEIGYVCYMMVVGSLFNAVLTGHVLNVLTGVDRVEEVLRDQERAINDFVKHAELNVDLKRQLLSWASRNAMEVGPAFDSHKIMKMIDNNCLPQDILERIPSAAFQGELLNNKFICLQGVEATPSLLVILAVALSARSFVAGQVVYRMYELPSHVYLIRSGTFAGIALPSHCGGVDATPTDRHSQSGQFGSRVPMLAEHMAFNACKGNGDDLQFSNLYPYHLFGKGCYFGEYDVFAGSLRGHTIRCESKREGVALRLEKQIILTRLQAEFPRVVREWKVESFRRESARLCSLWKLRRARSLRTLAATIIQRYMETKMCFTSKTDGSMTLSAALCPPEECNSELRQVGNSMYSDSPGKENSKQIAALSEEVHATRADVNTLMAELRGLSATLRLDRNRVDPESRRSNAESREDQSICEDRPQRRQVRIADCRSEMCMTHVSTSTF